MFLFQNYVKIAIDLQINSNYVPFKKKIHDITFLMDTYLVILSLFEFE